MLQISIVHTRIKSGSTSSSSLTQTDLYARARAALRECALVLCQPECVAAYLHFLLSQYNHLLKSSATLIRHLHGSPLRDMSFALSKDAPYRTLTASVLRSFCYHLYVLLCSLFSTTGGQGQLLWAVGWKLLKTGMAPIPIPCRFPSSLLGQRK